MKGRRWVLAAILLLAGAHALQGAGPDVPWLGVLWTKGSVSVGDAQVSSGTTVLRGGRDYDRPGSLGVAPFPISCLDDPDGRHASGFARQRLGAKFSAAPGNRGR